MHSAHSPFSFILTHANLLFYTLKHHAHLPFYIKHTNLPFHYRSIDYLNSEISIQIFT